MRTAPSSDVRGLARRASFMILAALCVTSMLATTASAASVATKKPKPKGGSTSLKALANALKAEEKASFSVTYSLVSPGIKATYSYAQRPPNFRLVFQSKSGSVVFIKIGSKDYGCESAAGNTFCAVESTSIISSELNWFQPSSVLPEIDSLAGGAKGVSNFTKKFAGQSAKCVSATNAGTKVTYCVTLKGILAEALTSGAGVTMTAFSSSPASSDFALPKGAKIEG